MHVVIIFVTVTLITNCIIFFMVTVTITPLITIIIIMIMRVVTVVAFQRTILYQ